MKMFWTLFVLDAWMSGGFLLNVLIGLADDGGDPGAILLSLMLVGAAVAALGGSLRLKWLGRMRAATILLLSIALLPVLIGIFFVLMLTSATNFR